MKLAKSYQASLYEADIYALWERSEAFKPRDRKSTFSVVVPPPNANGNLHLGHALSFALQDIAVRYHRSKGEKVLFLPGADHAGFETQVVYERELEKQGKSRFDYSRERLYDQIYEFVAANRQNFESQIRRLGASVDWAHYTFTLDENIVKRAYETFRSMWNEGLIYRGERLVNFCTFHGTAFADIEVDYQEDNGFIWQIRYPLTDGSGFIEVATTRPETMFGDTAVAVNPTDERYTHLIGKAVRLPLTNRDIPIIADDYVDKQFGTGAVKITPAHDPNDFEVGLRHDLPRITVIGFDGLMTHDTPETFRGMTAQQAREEVVKQLREAGVLVDAQDYQHTVGHCYKCGTVIEPLLKEQWFVNMKPLVNKALASLREGEIDFLPTSKQKQLEAYLANLKDWNISRQIAWGIPIPAFQNEEDPDDWVFDERVDQEYITRDNKTYRRDPDVFDTWFSSSSWPYATLGYPDSQDYKDFYPLSLMETGFDILMPWVSRMLMLGLYVTGKAPFKTVYLHGLVTDSQGQKMSKSKGNVVNPMKVIDQYGSDALRIGMIAGQTPGNNQPYVPAKVIGGRNFCNKLWNVARYIELGCKSFEGREDAKPLSGADHWILERYAKTLDDVTSLMENYRFSEAYEKVYHFIWDDFADWYIELSKLQTNQQLLAALLEAVLVLAHPFAPFLTETIWQTLELKADSLISNQALVRLPAADRKQAQDFATVKELISLIRSTLKALGAKNINLYYHDEPIVEKHAQVIQKLGGLQSVQVSNSDKGTTLNGTNLNVWLDIEQQLLDNYVKSLDDKILAMQTDLKRLRDRLNNKAYVEKAPAALVEDSRNQLVETEKTLETYLLERQRYRL